MAELITDEQKEKQPSSFLKVEDGSVVTLKSNLVKTRTHFLNKEQTSVACVGEDCFFCLKEIKYRNEYFYWGTIDGDEGLVRLPASIFFDLNESERVLKKSKRNFEWIISKTGSGLKTRYSVTRGSDAGKVTEKEVEKNNEKLLKTINAYDKTMRERYEEFSAKGKEEIFDADEVPLPNEEDKPISKKDFTEERG